VELRDGMVQIETGNSRISVPVDKIERITKSELKKSLVSIKKNINLDWDMTNKRTSFNPEIDIRGMRGEEALSQVRDLIDSALVVQYRNLRILHGKGNGILRQLVRQFLAATDIVKDYHDEHVDRGGSGITVVELDF
jgi:DNA mismatch repair protein MutS2